MPAEKKGVGYESVSPRSEEEIISFWKENKIFERSLQNRKKGKPFVFYEGPPYANGLPGIHHVEARTFKDVVLRYKTMRGFFVPRQAGWDTHGLPIEIAAERALGVSSKKEIEEKVGVEKFVDAAKANVFFYKDAWEKLTERMAYWLDLERAYVTMTPHYIESLWWVVSEISKKGFLQEGRRVLPWCSRCGTSLSSHELAQGYKKVTEDSVYVKFPLKQKGQKNKKAASFLVWTTTPWTLPANVALAVNPKINYVTVKLESASGRTDDEWLILAESRLEAISGKYTIISRVKGEAFRDTEYEAPYEKEELGSKKAYRVIPANFVSAKDGSGIVHIAPAFGADDFEVGKKYDLPTLLTVSEEGKMKTPDFPWDGKFVKDADSLITSDLGTRGLLFKTEPYAHDYPFCWRCQTPLIYYAKTSWFFKTTSVKEKMIAENKKIDWRPEYLKEGRFGGWLEENVDWSISRERYWGTPLPIWRCEKCAEIKVVGSLKDLDTLDPLPTTLILMRHGQAEHNAKGLVNPTRPETDAKNGLTEKGKKEVLASARALKKYSIDAIVSSPARRAKETAEMVGKTLGVSEIEIISDLYDILVEGFEGIREEEFRNSFANLEERFTKKPRGAENFRELRQRAMKAAAYIRKKYRGKTVLAVSHGDPIWLLQAALEGKEEREYAKIPYPTKTAGGVKVALHNWPYNHEGELDLHKPFIDSIQLSCATCKGSMKRISEVADVWFDSGAMPYESLNYTMENRELFKKRF
ncbi:MAG: class I tRNA ligase family protein, partial [Patescibacteria group bacterium]